MPALFEQVRLDHRYGRLPMVSIKTPSTWSEVASGRQDRWIHELLVGLGKAREPVLLILHHEPENDVQPTGMLPQHWVLMQTRTIRLAHHLSPNVTVVPTLMTWTFDPASRRSPKDWLVPDAEVFGVDVYNHWSATNGVPWTSFESRMDLVLPWTRGRPVAIPEFGCRTPPSDPQRAARWMYDAFDYAREHDVVAMSYFNSYLNSPDGSFELDAVRGHAFADLLGRPSVARI